MGNEELFKRISTDISITNMFIGFKIDTKDKILPNGLLPKPEFTDEWSSRVKLTTFQISHPFQNEFIHQRIQLLLLGKILTLHQGWKFALHMSTEETRLTLIFIFSWH